MARRIDETGIVVPALVCFILCAWFIVTRAFCCSACERCRAYEESYYNFHQISWMRCKVKLLRLIHDCEVHESRDLVTKTREKDVAWKDMLCHR